MSSKITIIGAGSVGATIAYKLSYGYRAGNLLQKPDLHRCRRL